MKYYDVDINYTQDDFEAVLLPPAIIKSVNIGKVKFYDSRWYSHGKDNAFKRTLIKLRGEYNIIWMCAHSLLRYQCGAFSKQLRPISSNMIKQYKHILSP